MVSTCLLALCLKLLSSPPAPAVLSLAILLALRPLTLVKLPPMKASPQWPELNAMLLTVPFTFGRHEVSVNGAVALKLNALFRVNVLPPCATTEKVPTAYMVLPHWTSWRTCSVGVVVAGKCGVPVAGCGCGMVTCGAMD